MVVFYQNSFSVFQGQLVYHIISATTAAAPIWHIVCVFYIEYGTGFSVTQCVISGMVVVWSVEKKNVYA